MVDITNEVRDAIGMIRDKSMTVEDRVKIALDLMDYISLKLGLSIDAIDGAVKISEEDSTRNLIKDSLVTFIFGEDEKEKDGIEEMMLDYFKLIAPKIKGRE